MAGFPGIREIPAFQIHRCECVYVYLIVYVAYVNKCLLHM